MEFARKIWKLLVALKDGLVLLLLLMFFVGLYGALTARPGAAAVKEGALLIDLDGVIVEELTAPDPLSILLSGEAPIGEYRARDIIQALRAAVDDDRINSVVLDLSGFLGGGFVHLQDIGAALDEVRAADKKVYTFGIAYLDDGMLLAAHSDEAWVDPNGGAFITGPGGNRLYFGELLQKLKINANVFRVGTFKSAVEPYLRNGPSEAAQNAEQALQDAIWAEWQAEYTRARPSVDLELVTARPVAWLKASGGDPALAAKAAGLVERIGTRTEFGERMAEVAGADRRDDGLGNFAHTGLKAWLSANRASTAGKKIGVVTVAGEIVDGDAGPGLAGGDRIAGVLNDALDRDFAALVVRVDSPGGSLMASEHIRRAIDRHAKKEIPVVVSMANVAASGGYWISTPASRIFAERGTITGSIGVFAVIPTFDDALNEIGVSGGGVKTTPLTGQPDLVSGLAPEVREMFQATIEHNYRRFLGLVAKSRGLSADKAEQWAEGRPWAGGAARQLGLIDEFGGIDDALAHAAKLAGLENKGWHAEYLGQGSESPLSAALGMMEGSDLKRSARTGDFLTAASASKERLAGQFRSALAHIMQQRGIQAYCLECPSVYSRPSAPTSLAQSAAIDAGISRLLGQMQP